MNRAPFRGSLAFVDPLLRGEGTRSLEKPLGHARWPCPARFFLSTLPLTWLVWCSQLVLAIAVSAEQLSWPLGVEEFEDEDE